MSFKLGDKVRVKAVIKKHSTWTSHEEPNELDPEIPIHASQEADVCGTKNWKSEPLDNPLTGIICGKRYLPQGYYIDGGPTLVQTGSVPVYLVAASMGKQVKALIQDIGWAE